MTENNKNCTGPQIVERSKYWDRMARRALIKVDRIGEKEIKNRRGVPVGFVADAIEIKPR